MQKILLLLFLLAVSLNNTAQERKTLITDREDNELLKAVINLEAQHDLFVGQSYDIWVVVSAENDIILTTENLKVEFAESSRKSTGGFKYTITPLDTGECLIGVGSRVNENKIVSLTATVRKVVDYPQPTLFISTVRSGDVLENPDGEMDIICKYPASSGVFDTYKIESWQAQIDGKTFEGSGNIITQELRNALKESTDSILYLQVELSENQIGHSQSEGVFIVP